MIITTDLGAACFEKPIALTIGFFDGVHRGHRFLIEQLKRVAREAGVESAVLTFATHPRRVLGKDFKPMLLTTAEEKVARLAETGVDHCIVEDFTLEMASLTAEEFMRRYLKESLNARYLLIGYDHRFGHDRTATFDDYVRYGQEIGIDVVKAEPLADGDEYVSSSVVRRMIAEGRVDRASELLTYPYELRGVVVRGYQAGRQMGFPTANVAVDADKLLPMDGSYAVRVEVNGYRYGAMAYVGTRPSLNSGRRSVEVHMFDFSGDVYDSQMTVQFVSFLRPSTKFDSIDMLRQQLESDRTAAIECLNRYT